MTTKTNKNLKKAVALGLCASLLASIGIGAYLTDTDTKSDVYTVGNVQAEIIANGDMELDNVGALLPGTVHAYERAASNTGINDAYVFMSVTIPYETVGVAADDGSQLGEKVMQLFAPVEISSEWKLVDDGFIGEYAIADNGQAAGEHAAYSVIADDTITYVYGYIGDNADGALKAIASGETTSNLVDEMKLTNLYNASKITGEISTKLYAIQSNHVNGGLTDVNGVWAVINNALVGNEDQVTKSNILMSGPDFYAISPKDVTGIEFVAMPQTYSLADRTVPADAFDVSEAQDGSIMAWVEDTILYVVAMDGEKIIANTDCNALFLEMEVLTYINMENLEFPANVNLTQAFSRCPKLNSVTLPDNIETINEWAFSSAGIVSITLPSTVTSIEQYAFASCSKLQEIVIPTSVTSIGDYAFRSSRGLTINFCGTEEQWNAINFGNEWNYAAMPAIIINYNYVPGN